MNTKNRPKIPANKALMSVTGLVFPEDKRKFEQLCASRKVIPSQVISHLVMRQIHEWTEEDKSAEGTGNV